MDDNFCTKLLAKHGANVEVNRDAKLGIKRDATFGSNDEANHGISMVAK